MSLSEPFIRRPVMTAVLTLSAVLFGVLCYFQLPVNDSADNQPMSARLPSGARRRAVRTARA